jgi:ribose/xylose/arabinose/galactoside ABC-type transport system permease subunit
MSTHAESSPTKSHLGVNWLKLVLARDHPYMLYVTFVVLMVTFSFASDVFFTTSNFQNIGRQTALVSVVAVGLTLVIIAGEIDLSVGSVLALAGMTSALAMDRINDSWLLGAVVGLATGATCGLVNGLLTTRLSIPSFLVTLGTLGIARGLALLVTGTTPVLITSPQFIQAFGEGDFIGIPAPIAWTIVIAVMGVLLLHFGTFGGKIYATGGNPTAARYSGISTRNVKTAVFVLTGALAGLAALVFSARAHAARPDVGAGFELNVIAAVILGGTSLFGGRGTIIGSLVGSFVIGILDNGLVLLGVSASLQLVIKGAIIIAAVAFGRK